MSKPTWPPRDKNGNMIRQPFLPDATPLERYRYEVALRHNGFTKAATAEVGLTNPRNFRRMVQRAVSADARQKDKQWSINGRKALDAREREEIPAEMPHIGHASKRKGLGLLLEADLAQWEAQEGTCAVRPHEGSFSARNGRKASIHHTHDLNIVLPSWLTRRLYVCFAVNSTEGHGNLAPEDKELLEQKGREARERVKPFYEAKISSLPQSIKDEALEQLEWLKAILLRPS